MRRHAMKHSGFTACAACLVIFALTGCASSSGARAYAEMSGQQGSAFSNGDYDGRAVASALRRQADEWKGVRYRRGGLSRAGIDCSGFVHVTYRNVFGLSVPRTTKSLAQIGSRVGRERLRPGDLVFFRTGLRKRHVGIYVADGAFLHASTSRGVTMSSLDEGYWDKSYRGARRVLQY